MPHLIDPPANWKALEVHPVAAQFPSASAEEYQTLRQDILERGLQKPITLHQGKVLAGKARLKACVELDIVPEFTEWEGDQTTLSTWPGMRRMFHAPHYSD